MLLLRVIWAVVRALVSKKADLVAENLALCHQRILLSLDPWNPPTGAESWSSQKLVGSTIVTLVGSTPSRAPTMLITCE